MNAAEIERMSYTDFVSLLQEENRPSGGKKSIRELILNSFVDRQSRVLEVGCTNGFSSLEIYRLLGCSVTGIDINPNSIKNAQQRAATHQHGATLDFRVASAYELPFETGSFDLVVVGNATSFMNKKEAALNEYSRVLKPWGFIGAVPIWYKGTPPQKILDKTSRVIGVQITPRKKKDWIDFFSSTGLEHYYSQDYEFDKKSPEEIETYMSQMLAKPFIQTLDKEVQGAIQAKWRKILCVFNENLSHAAYSVMLFRKRSEPEEAELFTAHPII